MAKIEKILVTGGAGFIGASLVSKLITYSNYRILSIDNLNDYYSKDLKISRLNGFENKNNYEFANIDINEFDLLEKCFSDFKPDKVYNQAAQAGVRYSDIDPISYINSNINGFFNVLKLCSKYSVERLIYASSSSVYGSSDETPFSEKHSETNPISLYGSTKLSNEKTADIFSKNSNLKLIGLRFFTVYGPKGRPDMAYFSFAKDILNGKKITVFNQGKMSRDMTYIDDICDGLLECLKYKFSEYNHEIFNLGNNYPVAVMDLIKFIEKRLKKKANITFKNSTREIRNTHADLSKSAALLNYEPKVSFEEGMEKFLNWFLERFKNEKT